MTPGLFDSLAAKYLSDKGSAGGPGHCYGKHYEEHAFPFLPKAPRILEIGVHRGGSLRMWEALFPDATIFGLDIDPACATTYTRGPVRILIGDQADRNFLRALRTVYGPFDMVVDDGSHKLGDILTSLDELWFVSHVYVIEDVETELLAIVERELRARTPLYDVKQSQAPGRFIIFGRRP